MNAAERQFFGFMAGGQAAYVPLDDVREIVRGLPFAPVSGGQRGVCGMVNLRGHVLTAIAPQRIWACTDMATTPPLCGQDRLNMIVAHAGTFYSFLIDRCGDVDTVLDTDIEPLTPQSGIWQEIAGGICARNGLAVPLLDMPRLLGYVEQGIAHRE